MARTVDITVRVHNGTWQGRPVVWLRSPRFIDLLLVERDCGCIDQWRRLA
jgi:hypothetical protein